ncbi:MAG: GNAT family N-acetyltransferase [Caldiserica bacterium]|jgi:ribosomal protein S18 acetylase RimI-like enzyme|nr:GNAT family N-acetyltransferase [Caldisericota bacterium]MDH7562512.1 GNAT family N-acetyltransferase [Caldisericota bacterium]
MNWLEGVTGNEGSMGEKQDSESGIFPADPSHWEEISSVLGEAFSEDEALRRLKRFPRENFPRFFRIASEFFLKSGKSRAWIFREGGASLGAVLCIPSNWSAPLGFLLSFFGKLWREIRWKSLPFLFSLLKSAWLSRPKFPCLRVLFLGVVPRARGKGIGRALLRRVFAEAKTPKVQLEVEKENKGAISLYLAEDFRIEREFTVGKVGFFVMVRELSNKQEPNQEEYRNKDGQGVPDDITEE